MIPPTNLTHAPGWQQLEAFVDQLQGQAHSATDATSFYRQLIEGCAATLAAEGGAVWLRDAADGWSMVDRIGVEEELTHCILPEDSLCEIAVAGQPRVFMPTNDDPNCNGKSARRVVVACTVLDGLETDQVKPVAVVGLLLRQGASPAVQQGWCDLLSTVCQIASEFHTLDQLRTLRGECQSHHRWLAFLERIHRPNRPKQTAFEIVAEGRSLVGADRLTVVLYRRGRWEVLAVSGVDRAERCSDTSKSFVSLAEKVSDWGEPIELGDERNDESHPPELAAALHEHIDRTHARQLAAVPVDLNFSDPDDRQSPLRAERLSTKAVFIAEQFRGAPGDASPQRLVELAQMSARALGKSTALDRFPLGLAQRWADRWQRWHASWGLSRIGVAVAATIAVVAALVWVPCDFEIQAPATLVPQSHRHVFATADAMVHEVRVTHGEGVSAGDVLAVLKDPQLAIDRERVEGEIATVRRRLEAIAVSRTDRRVQAAVQDQPMPLSAEGKQLEQQLKSLLQQRTILDQRHRALTITSPIAGQVLSLDVQNLLRSRPVERGQILFSVADLDHGWHLLAEVDQNHIGHVVAATKKNGADLPVRFRLASEAQQTFEGHVEAIAATALLDTENLNQESPPVQVCIAVDEKHLAIARPGMTAEVRIFCGRRSLGYVWLHDLWETIVRWVVF